MKKLLKNINKDKIQNGEKYMKIINVNRMAIVGVILVLVNFLGFPLTIYASGNDGYIEEKTIKDYKEYQKNELYGIEKKVS